MKAVKPKPGFDVDAFLRAVGKRRGLSVWRFDLLPEGEPADRVFYLQQGAVELSVVSRGGKAAVIARLGPGEFFGELVLTGHPVWLKTATARTATTVLVVPKPLMARGCSTSSTPFRTASSLIC